MFDLQSFLLGVIVASFIIAIGDKLLWKYYKKKGVKIIRNV